MLTYSKSGINRKQIYSLTRKINPEWGFASVIDLSSVKKRYQNPVLISSTDGVGTKIWLALKYNILSGIGQDLVAMNVNDIATCGARPLFFMDYYSTRRISGQIFLKIIKSIKKACEYCDMRLVGGETAIHPVFDRSPSEDNDVDLAGFVVGIAERNKLMISANVKYGDKIIGVASSGLHSNGFTLIRKAVHSGLIKMSDKINGKPIINELLTPTFIYSKLVLKLASKFGKSLRTGANITGGSIYKNLSRVIPLSLKGVVYYGSWNVSPIFKYVISTCNIDISEMISTFNMGVGFMFIVESGVVLEVEKYIEREGFNCSIVGEVTKNKGRDANVEIVF
ncbi:MAG: phosphoribosylformylglycinamidine cyclo-ligase [Planctomycetes bacterium]|nr:phosphoribosylformylglycinamidine cyclo-ligase [Planctomycetota bacterium]